MKTSLVRILVFPVFICRVALLRKACPRQRDLPRYSYPPVDRKIRGGSKHHRFLLAGPEGPRRWTDPALLLTM
jgi:hypothetical protein